ncbi:hypothetical protein COLO4_05939 [Corchorus olitorius]|uniref:Uncharacterized protein n=1 Tax=Corchorus olitorius TaxID=93759 RepID=A0A1R3GMR1_9ROSI|nr:hypothetical protein COLO4_34255 [Corchorus olitorius]OMP08973.1 hypothetical protein COLO4_05939 [Corchorus olitorius]
MGIEEERGSLVEEEEGSKEKGVSSVIRISEGRKSKKKLEEELRKKEPSRKKKGA